MYFSSVIIVPTIVAPVMRPLCISELVSPGDFQAVHLLANLLWSPLTLKSAYCNFFTQLSCSLNAEQKQIPNDILCLCLSLWLYWSVWEVYDSSGIQPHVLYIYRSTPGTRRALWPTEELSSQQLLWRGWGSGRVEGGHSRKDVQELWGSFHSTAHREEGRQGWDPLYPSYREMEHIPQFNLEMHRNNHKEERKSEREVDVICTTTQRCQSWMQELKVVVYKNYTFKQVLNVK